MTFPAPLQPAAPRPSRPDVRKRRLRLGVTLVALCLVAGACNTRPTPQPPTQRTSSTSPTPTTRPPTTTTTRPPTTSPTPAGTTDALPQTTVTTPTAGTSVQTPLTIRGLGTDDRSVVRVTVTVKDTSTGLYWNPTTRAWQTEWLWYDATLVSPHTTRSEWTFRFDPTGTQPSGLYQVRAFAWDSGGRKDPDGTLAQFTSVPTSTPSTRTLVWSDDFNGTQLDPHRWRSTIGGYGTPYRDQYYTDRSRNVRVENGNLVLQAHREAMGGQNYTSGMVNSNDISGPNYGSAYGNLSWRYGRMEMRARLPEGAGVWPAFWMRPENGQYGGWPRSGEIDIMEYPGSRPHGSTDPRGQYVVQDLHWWDRTGSRASAHNGGEYFLPANFFDGYHTFAVEWDRTEFRWYIDGRLVHRVAGGWEAPDAPFPAPFDQPFYITLNLQIDGWAGTPDPAAFPAAFQIDWVRVYQ